MITGPDTRTAVDRADVIVARRVPPARGGADPRRTTPADLQRLILPAWADRTEPLGEWTLRRADGFTRRANSGLAVGDPGLPIDRAAAAVIEYYLGHGLSPVVQVIADDPVDRGLADLGWTTGGPDTDLLVSRLADLIVAAGTGRAGSDRSGVELSGVPDDRWLRGLMRQRGLADLPPAGRTVLAGPAPVIFAVVTDPKDPQDPAAMARGQISEGWLGVSAVWTRPDHRRRGLSVAVIAAIASWAAIQGARNVYLQVEHENHAAQAVYAGLGFTRHHGYRYLRPPD